MASNPSRLLRLAALGLALCLAAAAPAARAEDDTEAAEPQPRYLLQDPSGRVVTHESFRGRFQLVAFGFVSCPDVCPTTLLAVRDVIEALGPRAARLQALFITVDPERDSAEVLRDYTAAFHPAILGLRGSPELLARAAASFRVRYEKVREPGAAPDVYTMDHSAGLYLLDGDGAFVTRFAYAMAPREIAARIAALVDAAPPPPTRRATEPLR